MNASTRAVVTGTGGFVGRALRPLLHEPSELRLSPPDWRQNIERADFAGAVVFHLAARVHQREADEALWLHDNVDKAVALAEAASARGARRFVFASTVKIHGEETRARPFVASDPANPFDAYARSKWLAEERLREISRRTGLELVVVRAPLVLGPDAKANLDDLMRLADTPWPLPFAAIRNRRSWLHVGDLAALLLACASHPDAVGKVFLAGHAEPFSTPGLVGEMRRSLGRPRRLFATPPGLLETAAGLIGASDRMKRLTRSLEVDATQTRDVLGWRASVALPDAVDESVRAYRAQRAA